MALKTKKDEEVPLTVEAELVTNEEPVKEEETSIVETSTISIIESDKSWVFIPVTY